MSTPSMAQPQPLCRPCISKVTLHRSKDWRDRAEVVLRRVKQTFEAELLEEFTLQPYIPQT